MTAASSATSRIVRSIGSRLRWPWFGRGQEPEPLLQRLKPLIYHRWLQLPMVLGIGAALFYDRYYLCKQYLFRYTDEDQAIMWYAAHEILQGRLHEPCFFGQDYNSCLEGYLAAPLIAGGMPYHVAVPLVTVILGLLPFLLLALVAWKRGHSLVAGAALLVPLLLPVRYSIITGIPRGFVTGIAISILPALLLLPPAPRPLRVTPDGAEPSRKPGVRPRWLSRTWPALRYFLAAGLSVVALQINPNCAIFLVPVAVYALLTSWREWKFWVFGAAGLIAAAPYPIYVYQFYYMYHPDYVAYLRGVNYQWGYTFYNTFFNEFVAPRMGNIPSPVLKDLAPFSVDGIAAPAFIAAAFALVTALLLIRRRAAGVAAALAGALFMFITFGYDRVRTYNGNNSASFPFCRMYLALPVVFVWLLFLVNHTPWQKLAHSSFARWLTRGVLAGMLVAGIHAFNVKQEQIDPAVEGPDTGIPRQSVLYPELQNSVVCAPIPVDNLYAISREVQKTADAHNARLLIVGGGSKWIAYAIPALTNVETLYLGPQNFERRTWRIIEENSIKRNNVLFIDYSTNGALVGGNKTVIVDGNGDPVDPATLTTPIEPLPSAPGANRGGRGGAGSAGGPGAGGTGAGRGGAGAPNGPNARGGNAGGGTGIAGGNRGGNVQPGGGRGFAGRGRISMDPTQQDVPHLVEIPPITALNLGGHTVFQSQNLLGTLPRLILPDPKSGLSLQMYRPNWGGR